MTPTTSPPRETQSLDELCINTIRTLAMDAVQKANSGHPGTPMALAPLAYVLYTRVMHHNPSNADWFDRDYYSRSPIDDPRGPAQGFIKVVRGGDWRFIGEPCQIEYAMLPPWKPNPMVGFRVVCERMNSP